MALSVRSWIYDRGRQDGQSEHRQSYFAESEILLF
jgi:hypothetical protein